MTGTQPCTGRAHLPDRDGRGGPSGRVPRGPVHLRPGGGRGRRGSAASHRSPGHMVPLKVHKERDPRGHPINHRPLPPAWRERVRGQHNACGSPHTVTAAR